MGKPFILLLAVVIGLGASLGGAFAGGVALGKSRQPSPTGTQTSPGGTGGPFTSGAGTFGPGGDAQRAQVLQSMRSGAQAEGGRISPFQGQPPFGGEDRSFLPGAGLTGNIEKIEGNTLTINTPEGPVLATIDDETRMQVFSQIRLEDLLRGMRVTVVGQRDEEGNMVARTLTVMPEGAQE